MAFPLEKALVILILIIGKLYSVDETLNTRKKGHNKCAKAIKYTCEHVKAGNHNRTFKNCHSIVPWALIQPTIPVATF